MVFLRTLFSPLLFLSCTLWFSLAHSAETTPLPPSQVFQLYGNAKDNQTIQLQWHIKEGYYLYRNHITLQAIDPKEIAIGHILLPTGLSKTDDILGKYQVYKDQVTVAIPIINPPAKQPITLLVRYQGCSIHNYCYPPQSQTLTINLSQLTDTWVKATTTQQASLLKPSEQNRAQQLLQNQPLWIIVLGFYVFGLLLAFTPCVLPMVPILSSIIVGKKALTTSRAFSLSFVYVTAMAITYALAGVGAGLLGASIQGLLQTPWIIVGMSLLFVALALSLFGFYEIQLPAFISSKASSLSDKQTAGNYWGVATMGILSALIVSPCVTAPLVGALTYISQTGNSTLGGIALLSLGYGMGTPLLLIGTSAGKLLPHAGGWMNRVKTTFGLLLLAMAIWLLQRILPGSITMGLWSLLLMITAITMGLFKGMKKTPLQKLSGGFSLLVATYSMVLLVGATLGNTDPLHPLENLTRTQPSISSHFTSVKTLGEVNQHIRTGRQQGKTVLLDFYADWCIACKHMERRTFGDADIQRKLKKYKILPLQADITHNDKADRALMAHYHIIAPPAVLFFDEHGNEYLEARLVGEVGPEELGGILDGLH